jgi:hypothetical protein
MFDGSQEKETIWKSTERSYGSANDDPKYSIDFLKFEQSQINGKLFIKVDGTHVVCCYVTKKSYAKLWCW